MCNCYCIKNVSPITAGSSPDLRIQYRDCNGITQQIILISNRSETFCTDVTGILNANLVVPIPGFSVVFANGGAPALLVHDFIITNGQCNTDPCANPNNDTFYVKTSNSILNGINYYEGTVNGQVPTDVANFPLYNRDRVTPSPNISALGEMYTVPLNGGGDYTFFYTLNVREVVSQCAVGRSKIYFEQRRGVNIIGSEIIYSNTISFQPNANTINVTLSGSVDFLGLQAGDKIILKFDGKTQLQVNCNSPTDQVYSIEMEHSWCLGSACPSCKGLPPPPPPTSTLSGCPCTYNYWIAGINCDNNYGEYLEPVDGDC